MTQFLKNIAKILLLGLVAYEAIGQVDYRVKNGRWLFQDPTLNRPSAFIIHPWLVGTPKPNLSMTENGITLSHNSWGWRGYGFPLNAEKGRKRIICYGGSTTYCTGLSDDKTWPYLLGEALGKGYEVLNAGVPGYGTAEAIIQTALGQLDLSPDICIYYEGWNDLRNSHVEGLRSDYSDFHGHYQVSNLQVGGLKAQRFFLLQRLSQWLEHFLLKGEPYQLKGITSASVDPRALRIYRANLKTLADIGKARGLKMVFVPQVVNVKRLTGDRPYGWVPFVKEKDLVKMNDVYNETMLKVCAEEGVFCVESVLRARWEESDFQDRNHFSVQGSKKFARLVADDLSRSVLKI